MSGEERWCVVTGGRGFAARHLVLMLIKYGMFSVRVADLGPTIKLDADEENGVLGEALKSGRAQYVSADLRDKSQLLKAFHGAEVVFHMAAPDSSINNHNLHYSVNVQGTKNVIDACVELKIKRLIYTSSPSVVFDGVNGIFNGNESLPYPPKFIIGDGNNMYDFTYVENVAHAHICAERALASDGMAAEKAAGQAYFITNMEPIKFWEFMSLILEGLGYERPKTKIPAFVVMPIAHMVALIYKLLAPFGMKVPQLTPSRIRLLSRSRTFDCSKANDLLGYTPIVPLQEGLRRTIESYPHLRGDVRTKRNGPSKSELILGSGKVADTLLWRDKKQTLTVLFILAAVYCIFIATGYTVVTAVSNLLLMALVFLLIHGKLPQKILGYKIEKIPESGFHVSEAASHHFALSVASWWNSVVSDLKSLCNGNDFMLFLKVVLSLLFLSILGAVSLHNAFVIGLPFAFISFVVYEKKEEEIDNLVRKFLSFGCKLKSDVNGKISSSKKQQ
ncbi:UNVERIFIED_CONTAM: 3beta-hydroxysteroid-dehydrogenase/decarboxylase isoform 2 [Sesamum latifolium]|uniref:Reticulon-like protein n=1 Tax=Sesamum latifolium TaxID=2727402 RepID=A0AAW2SQ93_9LAMI